MWGNCLVWRVRRLGDFGTQLLIGLALCTVGLHAQNCAPPPPGLVSWWPGNGNANDLVGANPGTITTQFQGQVLFSEGKVGTAFDFRGANFVEIPSIPLNSFTLEFWVNQRTRNADTNIGSILVSAEVCGVVDDWGTSLLPDGRLRVQIGDVTQPVTSYSSFPTSVSAIPLNTFTHVAVTRNTSDSEIKIYFNGVLDSTHISPHNRVLGAMDPTCDSGLHQNRIGIGNLRRSAVLGGNIAAFDGLIDEVSLYNRTLSVGEVAAIYNAGSGGKCPPASEPQCVQVPSDLVSWWKGDGNANDATGAYNSTFMNGITFTDGMVGQAFDFNGIDSQVTFGNTVGNFDTNDFTVEFWIRTTSTRHESVIEKWPRCGYASMWGIRIGGMAPWSGPGRLEAEMYSDTAGTDQKAISAGRPINDGLFHHVALVRTGTNLVFYIDGVPDVVTNVMSGSISRINNTANLTVGRSVCVGVDGTSPFTGQLDELAVYNRALAAPEIQEIYNAGGAGKCPAGPFTNGSFELPPLASGASVDLPARSTLLKGWTVGDAGLISWRNGPAYGVAPVDGAQEIGFNGADTPVGGSISQMFITTVGQTYQVRFNVGRQGPGSGTMSLLAEVTSSSHVVLGSLNAVAPESPGYGPARTFSFTATTSASTLTFRDTSSATTAVDALLDNVSVVPVQSCVQPPSGLVSWWRGDGAASDAVGSNNGALVGNTTFAPGVRSQAFSFDGDNDSVMIGNPATLQLQNFTIEAWIKRASTNQASLDVFTVGHIFGYGYGGYVFGLLDDGRLSMGQVGLSGVNSTLSVRDTNWHHVAVSKTAGAVAFYVDGVREAVPEYNPNFYFVSSAQVGASQWDGSRPTGSFLGLIDEVSVYNRGLASSEVQSIYQASSSGKCAPISEPDCVGRPSSLVSWWPGGANTTDIVGGNSGGLRGNASYADGKVGQAFQFDGNGDGVLIGNPANLRLQNFTIEGWIKRGSAGQVSASSIFGEIVGYGSGGYVFGFLSDGRLFLSKNGVSEVHSARPIADTTWRHVAVTKSGGSVVFYVDGASETTQAYEATFEFSTDLVIGAVNSTMEASFLGSIDELSIYSRPLTASEVQAVYNAGNAGKCATPPSVEKAIAHWKFDETSGAIAHDSAGLYNGTLSSSGASFVTGGMSGGALSLSKTNNGFVNMGNVLGLGNTDFSLVAWIKMSAGDISDTVILSKQAAYSRNGFLLDVNKLGVFVDNKASFVEGGSGFAAYTIEETPISTTSVNDGNWHQVVATFQTGGVRSIYVDGAPAENTKLSQPFNQNDVAFLVGGVNYEGVPTSRFDGLIDEVQIYNYALADSDVDFLFRNPGQEIAPRDPLPGDWRLNTLAGTGGSITREPDLLKYANGATVTITAVPAAGYVFRDWSGDVSGTTNRIVLTMTGNKTANAAFALIPIGKPLAHWTFDESGGSIAHDNAGSYDGVLSTNGASFVTNGIAGNALSITKAGNGFVNMGDVLGLESGDFSVLAWVKMTAGDTQSSAIVSKQRAGYANGYVLAANRSEGPTGGYAAANKAWFYDSDFHGQEVTSTSSVNDGNWHQIVGVYVAGANKYIYVDGAPAEASNASRPIVANPGKLVVGGVDFDGTPGGMFSGLIDDVQIYNYALNPAEVDFLFGHPGQAVAEHVLPVSWVVKTSVSGSGSITRDPELPRYPSGTNLSLTAVPGAGFAFAGWSGDVVGTNNPITLTVNSDKNATARFIDVGPPTVTITSPLAGTNTDGAFQLSGTVSDNVRVLSVRWEWNGQAAGFLPLIENRFSVAGLQLYQGVNRLRVIARDAAGNEAAAEVVVTLRPLARALAHWKFDEVDGTVAHDSRGSYNGTLSAAGASFVPGGKAGNALSLSKTNNGLVRMGNVLGLGGTDFSIVAWIKMAAGDTTESSMILSKHAAYTRNGYGLMLNKTGGLLLDNRASFIQGGSGVGQITTAETPISTTAVNDGNWHQIVAVFQVGGMKSIYVDGAPAEDSKPSQPFNQNSVALLIGGANFDGVPTGLFTGLIDEVQIYNYALTATDVDLLFINPSEEIPDHELPVGWTLNTAAAGGGTIQRDPDLARYPTGTNVTLRAVANTGFVFVGWSGDASGTNNPITLTMSGNKTVTASFAEIPLRVLAVVNPGPKQEGDMIVFDLRLSSPGDVGGMNFVLRYDPVYLKDPTLDWSPTLGVSALDQVNYDTPGEIHAVFALPATTVPTGTQQVASMSFRARSVPNDLDTALGLEVLDVSAPTGDPIANGNAARGGVAHILRRHVTGDNNANNRLDVGDATIIQRLLIGLDPTRSWDVTGNDVNGNIVLDSGDIIRVLRVVAEIDPQPAGTQTGGSQSTRLTKARLGKASSTSESVVLQSNRLRAQSGDLIIVQAVLQDIITPISGASFTLDYPTNALRLLNSLSLQTGSLVPGSAVSVWNVQPAQNNYTLQSGQVSFVASSATQWAAKNGVLAEFVFQVQPGQTAQYRWPVRLSDLELTADGYDVRPVPQSEIYFIGRDPIPPDLSPASGSLTSNGFSLSLSGEPGVSYSLEVSSDLTNWLPLFSLTTGSNGALSFVDPAATNSLHRFYRAKQQ